ncbi:unnamed protein product [Rhizopus stolonifer]
MALSCSPLALHFQYYSMTSAHTTHKLIHNDLMLDMLAKVPENHNYSQLLECIVQIHKDVENSIKGYASGSLISVNDTYVEKIFSSPSLPGLGEAFTFAPLTAVSYFYYYIELDYTL